MRLQRSTLCAVGRPRTGHGRRQRSRRRDVGRADDVAVQGGVFVCTLNDSAGRPFCVLCGAPLPEQTLSIATARAHCDRREHRRAVDRQSPMAARSYSWHAASRCVTLRSEASSHLSDLSHSVCGMLCCTCYAACCLHVVCCMSYVVRGRCSAQLSAAAVTQLSPWASETLSVADVTLYSHMLALFVRVWKEAAAAAPTSASMSSGASVKTPDRPGSVKKFPLVWKSLLRGTDNRGQGTDHRGKGTDIRGKGTDIRRRSLHQESPCRTMLIPIRSSSFAKSFATRLYASVPKTCRPNLGRRLQTFRLYPTLSKISAPTP